ncbi:MAG: DNA repair protein RadC [Acidobacteria bacterium]|nr:DNA repair protein RadC [Acidobacteriota bacterium]
MTGHRTNGLRADGSLMTRERLERHGAGVLADEELLAILVGVKGVQTAGAVLEAFGTVQQLAHESTGDLARIKGMTPTRAAMVVAGVELGRRTLTRPRPDRQRLGTPREVAAFLLPHYGASPIERFGIISLCTKHRMLRTEIVSTGTLDASLVHPREVFRMAAMHRAAAIVLFHNHPSGDPTPSHDDVALTARLQEAGTLMGIEVLDHVILADTRYCSFKEMGRL